MLIPPEAEKLFNVVQTLAPEDREAYLANACDGDPALLQEVSSLMTAANQSEAYFSELSDRVSLNALAGGGETAIAGKTLGQWKLLSLLGSGGMGSVYLAERADGQFHKQVALKTLPIGLDNDNARSRFLNERQILAQLVHDNIARLLDGGVSDDGTPYFVMDYVAGERIDAYCQREKFGVRNIVDLLLETARGVQYAHRNLIIHRDLKPSNILVDESGRPRLMDFGVAKVLEPSPGDTDLTRIAQRPVTPAYASPEMLRGEPVDVTADVYSLGAVLYQLVTDTLPVAVEGLNLAQMHAHVDTFVPVLANRLNPEVDSDLAAILAKALARLPSERYESVESLSADLRNWRDGRPVSAKPPSALYRTGKFLKRNLAGVSVAAVAVLGLTGFALFAMYSAARSEQQSLALAAERDRAEATRDFLISIFDAAGPKAAGETLTAAQMLEAGRSRVNKDLADQPRLQSDMLGTIGHVYATMGVNDKWRELLYEQKSLVATLDGKNSQAYFDLLVDLAEAEDMLGDYDQAQQIAHELIAISDVLGDPVSEGDARSRLGRILHLKGDYGGADREYRAALQLHEGALGNDDMRTARAKLHLATLLDQTQDHEAAYRLFVEVEEIHKRVKKDEEVIQTDLYLGMARALGNLKRYDEAMDIYQRTFDANKRVYGPDYSYNLYIVNGMSSIAETQGRYERALELQDETYRLLQMHMPGSPNIGRALLNRARILQVSDRCALAEPVFREALAIFAEQLPNHSIVGQARWRLGVCLAESGRNEEAEAMLTSGCEILASHLKPDHKEVLDAKAATAAFFDRTGDAERAAAYR